MNTHSRSRGQPYKADDMLEQYIEFMAESESPTTFHRWSFLACCSAALGRNVWLDWGRKRVFPVLYVIVVGVPATRKSSAINACVGLLRDSGYKRVASDKTSKQQFVQELARPTDFEDALLATRDSVDEMFIANDEFLDFIGRGNMEFSTFLAKMWDCPREHKEVYKSGGSTVCNPTINILAGMTQTGLQLAFPDEATGTGFLSRPILVYGEPTDRRITFPRVPEADEYKPYTEFFRRLRSTKGAMKFTPDAMTLADKIYKNFSMLPDARLSYYCGRRLEHMFRLCMVLAAIRGTLLIDEDVVCKAHTILTFTEEHMHRAFGEYGRGKLSEAAHKVVSFMESLHRPCTADEIYKAVSHDLERFSDIFTLLQNLQKSDRIISAGNTFILKQVSKNDRRRYTDFKRYIREAEYYEQYEHAQQQLQAAIAAGAVPGDSSVGGLDKL